METSRINVNEKQYQALVALLPEETSLSGYRIYWVIPSLNDGVAIVICRVDESGKKETIMEILVEGGKV